MWYLFHGPNALARDEEIAKMKAKLGEPDIAAMNTTVLDNSVGFTDIVAAADAMPFLAEKRLVVVRNWLRDKGKAKRGKGQGANADADDELTRYLRQTSETTRLVFAEDEALPDSHSVVQLAQDKASGGHIKLFELPDNPVRWITDRAKHKNSEIAPQAALLLGTKINRGSSNDRDHFISDSRTYLYKLDNELEKLVAYAHNRRIESADVEALVKDEDIADIFKFIDAISLRNGAEAFKFVRGVLTRGESPLVVLSHLARQIRLMIQAKEHEHLSGDALAQLIGVHPFAAKKALQQSQRFGMAELISALESILRADSAIKTGQMDDVTALDVLVAAFCG
jgi:DNA polymerase-3 subunit delta